MDPTQQMFRGLKDTFQRMTDIQSAVQALQEFDVFRQKVGEYGSEMAMRMAMDPKTSPSSWWMMFGSSTPKLQYSSSSYSDSRHSFHYPIPDISMQPPTRWVYEWENPHFYAMLVQEWQTTSAWTGQTWQHYKADLLRVRGIALMSTAEYQTASQMGVFPFLR